MEMTTTQRVDVKKWVSTSSHGGMVSVVTNAPEHTYVKWPDYAALLQQVAEAERAREEAESAWRFAFVSVTQSLNIKDGMKVEQARIHAEARAEEIHRAIAEDGEAVAAFLAANGGGDHG